MKFVDIVYAMNQTNVVVGKYNFIITETTMAMGTVISRKNYKPLYF